MRRGARAAAAPARSGLLAAVALAAIAAVTTLVPACSTKPAPAPVPPAPTPAPSPTPVAPPPTPAPSVAFREVPAPRIDVSLAVEQSSFALPFGDWLVRAGGAVARLQGRLLLSAPSRTAAPLWSVQAGSFGMREAAEAEAARLTRLLGLPATVAEGGGRFGVRAGAPAERKEAEALLMKVRRDAVPEAFLVGASPNGGATGSVVVEEATGRRELPSPVELQAADGSLLPVGDGRYRGTLLVRATGRGTVHVIDRVNLEDYLKGVVPGEMGPRVYDEVEALKAQTIAARSYAVRHLGDFAAEGYDLCATPRCQVYGGAGVEQPLSTQAVEETAGEVLLWKGQVADTLFTSTCGGRTEAAANVFPGYASVDAPYLASVPCWGETPWALATGSRVAAEKPTSLLGLRGRALLASLGRKGTAWADLKVAHAALRERMGLPPGAPPRTLAPAGIYEDLAGAAALGDPDLLTEEPERAAAPAAWPTKARDTYAVLVRFQLTGGTPLPVERAFRPEEAAGLWASLLIRMGGLEEVDGRLVGVDGTKLTVKGARGRVEYDLEPDAPLARGSGDGWEPVRRLDLFPGDRIRLYAKESRAVALAAPAAPARGLYERDSAWVHWIRRYTGTELMAKLRERDASRKGTTVRRLQVLSRGESGRAKQVRVTTDRETFTLTGLEIRFALSLPETLFTLAPGTEPGGETIFTFYGRGWGHGVGLCQNGAFGMSLAGKGYREILAHYYPGAVVGPAPQR